MYKLQLDEDKNIHLGIVMAGAVTAGAYTAGVMDYLVNSLKLWEQKHANGDPVPKPNVKLDVFTGASAGSITAAVTLLALATGRTKPVEDLYNDFSMDNLFFYTWVNLGLEQHEVMWQKLLDTTDLEDGDLKSIFNTSFIDELVEKIVAQTDGEDIVPLPKFVNPEIDVLMTLSNLRGIPINLSFSAEDEDVAHTMIYHKAFAHFKYKRSQFDYEDAGKLPLVFENKALLAQFLEISRASGAFPIGLRSSLIENIDNEYIQANLKEIFGTEVNIEPILPETYSFIAVDGGMTNNEPIAEALRIMKQRHQDPLIILIDPFPNYIDKEEELNYDLTKDSVFDITPQLIKTLRNQVLFKESDLVELFQDDIRRSMIWPTRYQKDDETGKMVKKMNSIACGALDGFAGFLSRDFRVHDYMLGQKNCQNFLRYYFHLEADDHPYCDEWTEEMKEQYALKNKDGKWMLPIIPDYRITDAEYDGDKKKFTPKVEEDENFPKFPSIDYEFTFTRDDGLEDRLQKRVEEILEPLIMRAVTTNPPNQHVHPWIKERMKKRGSIPNIDSSVLENMGININLGGKQLISEAGGKMFSKKITNKVMNVIIQTLSDYELFENDPAHEKN